MNQQITTIIKGNKFRDQMYKFDTDYIKVRVLLYHSNLGYSKISNFKIIGGSNEADYNTPKNQKNIDILSNIRF